MISKPKLAAVVTAIGAIASAGCTTPISKTDVRDRADVLNAEIRTYHEAEAVQRKLDGQLVVHVNTPYLSGRTVALSKDAHLPAVFSKSSGFVRNNNGGFTIPQVASLITRDYGIRVRVRPDVFLPASELIPGSAQDSGDSNRQTAQGRTQGTVQLPLPLPQAQLGPQGLMSNISNQIEGRGFEYKVDFDFIGSLSDYLEQISSKLGINWRWDDADHELVIYRLVRKTFILNTSPTAISLSSTVSKGMNASTGTAGGTGGGSGGAASSTSGTINGNAEASMTMTSDAWRSVVATLNHLRTRAGAVEANPATRTITMIDTRDVITDASNYMQQQNEILGRQVVLNVRLLRVSLNRTNQLGASLDLVLQQLAGGTNNPNWRISATGASPLANASAGSIAYSVLSPTNRAAGSSLIVNALRELGNVTDEFTQDVPIRNNHSVPISDFATFGFLSQTTPGTATGTAGTSGLPGLTQSTITSGTALMLTPSITSGDSLSLLLSLDRSADPTFDVISTGTGSTLQQIQLPRQRGIKIDTEVAMHNNQTLVLFGQTKNLLSNTTRNGILSTDNSAEGQKEVQVLLITPQIISGV